jgi:hypothetical protein
VPLPFESRPYADLDCIVDADRFDVAIVGYDPVSTIPLNRRGSTEDRVVALACHRADREALGQNPRPLQLNPTTVVSPHRSQRTRRKPVVEDATPEVRLELALDEGRPPACPLLPGRPCQEVREVRLDGAVVDGVLGLVALVGRCGGAWRGHDPW